MPKNNSHLKAFKAYDLRGKFPEDINEDLAYSVGRAYAEIFKTKKVVVGYDARLSSPALASALNKGLTEKGCSVIDLGLCGTEQVYFATFHLKLDGGIMITASHNPREYNGMKLVLADARPLSRESGLQELENLVVHGDFAKASPLKGSCQSVDLKDEYVKNLLGYININSLKAYKVAVNAGNGCAGPIIDLLEKFLPFDFVKLNHEPNGNFPQGIPNPLLPENRGSTSQLVRETGADLGIAWDGDFDRCFLFDEQGNFIEGYYLVGLLAQIALEHCPGSKIIHDPRLTWNTIDLVQKAGGIPVQSKTGHTFIKERMRLEDAIYGGEMSAHHYFKDFAYCDSGMIPWLLILELMSKENKTLSQLVNERIALYPVSGEINRIVKNTGQVMQLVEEEFVTKAALIDRTDGLSVEFEDWRFNLRPSNTEPVLRLNVEAKGSRELMMSKTRELLDFIIDSSPRINPGFYGDFDKL